MKKVQIEMNKVKFYMLPLFERIFVWSMHAVCSQLKTTHSSTCAMAPLALSWILIFHYSYKMSSLLVNTTSSSWWTITISVTSPTVSPTVTSSTTTTIESSSTSGMLNDNSGERTKNNSSGPA